MNRLKNQRCYLAGAIDRVNDRGHSWRDYISPFLQNLGVNVFNPLFKPTSVGQEDATTAAKKKALKQSFMYDELSTIMKSIRSVDLRLVDISDFLLVNLDIETHPCGTLEEIFWANRQKKPIIIRVEQGKHNAPDWLFGTIPHQMIFDNWDQVKTYLLYVNESENIEHFNRWYFMET